MNRELQRALRALANAQAEGPLDERLESAIDARTKLAILALAKDLAGKTGNPNVQRSRAARLLLKRGAEAMLADAAAQA